MAVGADELAAFQRELDAARTALETEGSVVRSNPFDVLMSGTRRRGLQSQIIPRSGELLDFESTLTREVSSIARAELPAEEIVRREALRRVGNVGSYRNLTSDSDLGGFFDGREAHHIIPERTFRRLSLPEQQTTQLLSEVPCIMLTREQHLSTISYGGRAYGPFRNFAEEVEANINDILEIFRADGTYTMEIETQLRQTTEGFMRQHADILSSVY